MDKVLIGYPMWEVFVLIVNSEIHGQEFLKPSLHLLSISESEVTEDQIEAGLEVGSLLHDVFKGCDGIIVLPHLHKHNANVLHDLRPEQCETRK